LVGAVTHHQRQGHRHQLVSAVLLCNGRRPSVTM
jgi:hypothetical protein